MTQLSPARFSSVLRNFVQHKFIGWQYLIGIFKKNRKHCFHQENKAHSLGVIGVCVKRVWAYSLCPVPEVAPGWAQGLEFLSKGREIGDPPCELLLPSFMSLLAHFHPYKLRRTRPNFLDDPSTQRLNVSFSQVPELLGNSHFLVFQSYTYAMATSFSNGHILIFHQTTESNFRKCSQHTHTTRLSEIS